MIAPTDSIILNLKTERMASGVEKQVSQHLECAVCLERLKEPKMLSCQHTYCRECLEELLNTDGRRRNVYEIKCPECRKKTRVSEVTHQYSYIKSKILFLLDLNSWCRYGMNPAQSYF